METHRKPKYISEEADRLITLLWELDKRKKNKAISIRLNDGLHEFIRVLAEIEDTTVSQIILEGVLAKAIMYLRNYQGPIHSSWMEKFPQYFGEKY